MENLYDRIIRHEGSMRMVYDDATGLPIVKGCQVMGNPTIGVGRLVSAPGGISEDEIAYLLKNDIDHCRAIVIIRLPWIKELSQNRQDVIYEMAFQLGINGLMQFKNMLNALQSGNWDKAAHEMLDSAWHKQTPDRCEELANLLLRG